jgi:hypothetical protein
VVVLAVERPVAIPWAQPAPHRQALRRRAAAASPDGASGVGAPGPATRRA